MATQTLLASVDLPPAFVLPVRDDALGAAYPAGCEIVFERTYTPQSGKPIMVRDGLGNYWLRLYRRGRGKAWQAVDATGKRAPMNGSAVQLVAAARWIQA